MLLLICTRIMSIEKQIKNYGISYLHMSKNYLLRMLYHNIIFAIQQAVVGKVVIHGTKCM